MILALRHRRTYPAPRLMAALLAICCIALGIAASPLASGIAQATDDCTYKISECITMAPSNDNPNQVLNAMDNGTANGTQVLTYAPQGGDAPAANERWRLATNDDGTFEIVNNNSGRCLDVTSESSLSTGHYLAYLWDCSNSDGQKFYAEPAGDTGGYRLRQASSKLCLSHPDKMTHVVELNTGDCTTDDSLIWNINSFGDGQTDGLIQLAAAYAIGACGADYDADTGTITCDLDDADATYSRGNPVCVLNFHNTGDEETKEQSRAVTETVADSRLTGQQTTTGMTSGVSIKLGALSFKSQFSKTWQETVQNTTTNTTAGSNTYWTGKVPAHSYAWLLATPITKSYTGNFNFNINQWNAWSYSAGEPVTVTVPADENGNPTLITTGNGPDSDPNNECDGQAGTFTGSSGTMDDPPGETASTTAPVS
ncbi:RICIN domain-containing protein [Streptomyces sp. bgisy130]|uniref:RICIN domain-containing protein n=1 Tax=Streptomyces sp. bgisy130 TaxID=3413788 RepID=UPI003F4A5E3B